MRRSTWVAREVDVLRLAFERFGGSLPGVRVGPGDDAAVLDDDTVVTVDTIVEGVHFDRRWASLADVGWKAVHTAVSDIPAMGARPTSAVVAAQLPAELSEGDVTALLDGLRAGADGAEVPIVGGDVTSSATLAVSIAVTGRLVGDEPRTRSGAAVGNIVAVIGHVGHAAAGLALHRAAAAGVSAASALLERYPELSEAHRRPRALVAAADVLAARGVTAAIDVSDGLGRDLGHVAAASAVRIELARLPIDEGVVAAADALALQPTDLVLGGGDDYALAVTIVDDQLERVRDAVTALGLAFSLVGSVAEGAGVNHGGEDVSHRGWEHR